MKTMSDLGQRACCFTGHRPQKLSFGYDEAHPACIELKKQLRDGIEAKIRGGCISFITGMAMGPDIWCAEMVLACRQKFSDLQVTLMAVIPYKNQPSSFPVSYQRRYADILLNADRVVCISEKYMPGCMHRRNKYMVDNAGCVIAVFSGAEGGTQDTLRYAQKKGLDIVGFHPDTAQRIHIPAQLQFEMEKKEQ